jgi:hypothetical protein
MRSSSGLMTRLAKWIRCTVGAVGSAPRVDLCSGFKRDLRQLYEPPGPIVVICSLPAEFI